jgi:hypothetical protein
MTPSGVVVEGQVPTGGPANKLIVVHSDWSLAGLARRRGKTSWIQEMKTCGHPESARRAGRGGEVIHRLLPGLILRARWQPVNNFG